MAVGDNGRVTRTTAPPLVWWRLVSPWLLISEVGGAQCDSLSPSLSLIYWLALSFPIWHSGNSIIFALKVSTCRLVLSFLQLNLKFGWKQDWRRNIEFNFRMVLMLLVLFFFICLFWKFQDKRSQVKKRFYNRRVFCSLWGFFRAAKWKRCVFVKPKETFGHQSVHILKFKEPWVNCCGGNSLTFMSTICGSQH